MRKIWILQTGSHNTATDRFEFYDVEAFSSKKKLEASVINRMIDCNKGFNIEREEERYSDGFNSKYAMITYKTISIDGIEMKVRYLLKAQNIQ